MTAPAWIGLAALGVTFLSTLIGFIIAGVRFTARLSADIRVTTERLSGNISGLAGRLDSSLRELGHDVRDLTDTLSKIEARQWTQEGRIAVLEAARGLQPPPQGPIP